MQTEETLIPNAKTVTPTGTEQVQTSEVVGQPTNTTQTEQSTETDVTPKPKNNGWVQRRIDELTFQKNEQMRKNADLEAQLRQYQTPQQQTPNSSVDIDEQVTARAAQIVKQQEFDKACNSVFENGSKEFPDFGEALSTFQLLGGAPADFLEVVTSMEEGHKVLHHLGKDPELAEKVLSMSPVKQALELARIESSLSKKTPSTPVSKAPEPITPIGGKSSPVEPSDFASTADYVAWRKSKRK